MNTFRGQIVNASPPEERKFAGQFIKDHPESLVSVYLVRKYFILSQQKDYKEAAGLISLMLKEQPGNVALGLLLKQIQGLAKLSEGNTLPAFSATDINGKKVSGTDLKSGDAVILVWASWAYETFEMRRILNEARKKSDGKLKVIGICVDPDKEGCRKDMERNKIEFPVICDGRMLDSKLLTQLGIGTIPDNIILHNGRVTEHGISIDELRKKFPIN